MATNEGLGAYIEVEFVAHGSYKLHTTNQYGGVPSGAKMYLRRDRIIAFTSPCGGRAYVFDVMNNVYLCSGKDVDDELKRTMARSEL